MKADVCKKRTIFVGEREIELKCPVCGCEEFYDKKTLLNTAGMTYLSLDWADGEATNYICRDCSYIIWFYKDVQSLENKNGKVDMIKVFEEKFSDYDDQKLRKIAKSGNYHPSAIEAARNLLKKRGASIDIEI